MTTDPRRRAFLQAAGSLTLLSLLPGCRSPGPDTGDGDGGGAGSIPKGYLTPDELDTLRALVDRLVPGTPVDPDPGALEAGVAEAIDFLLGAFLGGTPPIHAGGPFSDRAGGTHDDFADFVALDPIAELGWRIRIEGSQGLAAREFAGPVTGFQEIYRAGLAHLDERAASLGAESFAALAGPARDLILLDLTDGDVQSLVGTAFAHTLEFLYGAPEYGGNRGLIGWSYTRWEGDRQPTGFSDDEVSLAGPLSEGLAPTLIAQFTQLLGGVLPAGTGAR